MFVLVEERERDERNRGEGAREGVRKERGKRGREGEREIMCVRERERDRWGGGLEERDTERDGEREREREFRHWESIFISVTITYLPILAQETPEPFYDTRKSRSISSG